MKFIKYIVILLATASFMMAAAAPKTNRAESPTAEQVLPPITTSNTGWTVGNNGKNVIWIAPVRPNWAEANAASPDFIRNKPAIPAPQIQANWNQVDATKLDFIQGKPSLFDGDYTKLINKPTIPAAQVQSNWNQNDASKPDFIQGKPVIPTASFGVNAQVGTSYTIVASDAGKLVTLSSTENITLTVPVNLAITDGAEIEGVQLNTGNVTIVGAAGVTIVSLEDANKTSGKGSSFKLKRVSANVYTLVGELYSTKATIPVGRNVIFTAVGQGGTTPYTYQWKKNGMNITGETQVSLVLYAVTTDDTGGYNCAITNTGGTLLSELSTITVQ